MLGPEKLAVLVVIENREFGAPPQDDGERAIEAGADRGPQRLGPLLDRPERGSRPVELAHPPRHLAARLERCPQSFSSSDLAAGRISLGRPLPNMPSLSGERLRRTAKEDAGFPRRVRAAARGTSRTSSVRQPGHYIAPEDRIMTTSRLIIPAHRSHGHHRPVLVPALHALIRAAAGRLTSPSTPTTSAASSPGPKGPEAGVWVIAETRDLPVRYIKSVVTDDRGRFVVPDLPAANYQVWARGYGLVDSAKATAKPGQRLSDHRGRRAERGGRRALLPGDLLVLDAEDSRRRSVRWQEQHPGATRRRPPGSAR